jgi:hypothetical protein
LHTRTVSSFVYYKWVEGCRTHSVPNNPPSRNRYSSTRFDFEYNDAGELY